MAREVDPQRWQRIEEALRRALDAPEERRRACVDEACGDDAALRADVERLLAADAALEADAAAREFLSTPAADVIAPAVRGLAAGGIADAGRPAGTRMGPYRIEREIGRGGMGVVYLAERGDGQFEERVALKVLKKGVDSEEILRRFLQERQILAWLRHPNIASLLDGGLADDGVPYFVMEHVDGEPITRYCDARRLDVTARLTLFRQVCRGVQHAHNNLVVHRDLKPSNILVTAAGEVKLLDFGVAKVLGDGGAAHLTRTELRLLTPHYAAPEQLRGEPTTTATDVYGLGTVLHELLTGELPHRRRGRADDADREAEPRPPSAVARDAGAGAPATGLAPRRLARRLAGDVDNIVLKAIRAEPEARYPTAAALEEDIARHLRAEPVQARRPSLAYRTTKFLRRNRVGVLAGALVMLAVLGGAAGVTLQARKTAREARKAEAVKDFLARIFEVASPNVAKGEPVTTRQMLDTATARVDEELGEQPEVQAEILLILGTLYHTHGAYAEAESLLVRSVATQERLFGADDAHLVEAIGRLATVYQATGELDSAETYFRRALAITRAKVGPRGADFEGRLNDLAVLLNNKGDTEQAERLYREALELRRARLGDDHVDVATLRNNLAVLVADRGDFDEAATLLRRALAARRKAYGDEHLAVANTIHNLMVMERRRGDVAAAEPLAREALALRRKLLGPEHPDVSNSLFNLAAILHAKGSRDEAEPMYREAIGTLIKSVGEDHPDVAGMRNVLAKLIREHGDLTSAEGLCRDALGVVRRRLPRGHPLEATVLLELGENLTAQKRYAEAEPLLRQAVDFRAVKLGVDSPVTSEARIALGVCLGRLGRRSDAERELTAARTALQERLGPEDERSRRAATALEALQTSPGRF
jgi:serine/threonine-protein kinase